jgi:3-dehydroquinate dehydratase/shikimate dehydrogenase
MLQVELREAVARGAKFLEVRLDFLSKAPDFKRLGHHKEVSWMATLRRPEDGGRWSGSEEARKTVIRQAIVSGLFDWVDLETDIATSIPRFGPVKRVVSYHNMRETPVNLDEIYDQMLKQDGDVYKIAVMACVPADCRRVIELQKRAPKPTIAFCLGDLGFPTRFLALKYWAPWIYAAFNNERFLAPGLPSMNDFRTTYPVKNIGPDTRFYGLLGDPVAHSFSPILHNHMFQRMKVNACYVPFRVPQGQLPAALEAFETAGIGGYSVTIPHKETAAQLAVERDASVIGIHAANTLVARPDGKFNAANTDHPAAIESIRTFLKAKADAEGTVPMELNQIFFLILGAGGVSRAIAHALHQHGAHVTITSRTFERAAALAEQIGCKVCDWDARHNPGQCDFVINGTPVGMHPNVNESPLHVSFLRPGLTVFDTVYNPETTLLIRDAESRGCSTITGVDMFVRQAAMQFERFTGLIPPMDQMRELLRKATSPLTRAMDEELAKSQGAAPTEEPAAEEGDDD